MPELENKADKIFETLWSDNEFREYTGNNNIPLEFIINLVDKVSELASEELKEGCKTWETAFKNLDHLYHEVKAEKLNELKNRISLALKEETLQQGFEIICKKLSELEKENAELKEKIESYRNAVEECRHIPIMGVGDDVCRNVVTYSQRVDSILFSVEGIEFWFERLGK